MKSARIERLCRHHCRLIVELAMLLGFVILGPILAFKFDFFDNGTGPHPDAIELDEVLLLAGLLLALALALFTLRRYVEQRREMLRRTAAEREIRRLAFQDPLTGLPNRRRFDDALQRALGAPPHAQAMHGVFLLDLNGFKQINDIHGHDTGDDVLTAVAHRLLSVMREGDLVARFGGDEFAILAQHLLGPESAKNLALRVIQALEAPIAIGRKTHRVGVAIGIALIPGDATTRREILRKADVALYRAKAERRSAMRFFEAQMDRHIHEHERMERELRAALAADQLRPVFEPSICLQSGRVLGFEAIPRWVHPQWGEIPPPRFIAVAEQTGLVHDLADRVLRHACVAAKRWPPEVQLAVDLLPGQLSDRELPARILETLRTHGIACSRLELEVTESSLVRDVAAAELTLGALHDAGVRITLDHFGTGYSTLYHLRKCKLDKVKIDPIFVTGMGSEREKERVVNGLVGLGHGLGLAVAAGGICSEGEGASLLFTGCLEGQGGWISAPVTAEATLRFFNKAAVSRKPTAVVPSQTRR